MRLPSSRSVPVLGAASLLLLSGCSEGALETIDEDAATLAGALTSGDFSGISFRPGADADAEALSGAVENLHTPLGELSPEVEVTDIEVSEPEEDSPGAPARYRPAGPQLGPGAVGRRRGGMEL